MVPTRQHIDNPSTARRDPELREPRKQTHLQCHLSKRLPVDRDDSGPDESIYKGVPVEDTGMGRLVEPGGMGRPVCQQCGGAVTGSVRCRCTSVERQRG